MSIYNYFCDCHFFHIITNMFVPSSQNSLHLYYFPLLVSIANLFSNICIGVPQMLLEIFSKNTDMFSPLFILLYYTSYSLEQLLNLCIISYICFKLIVVNSLIVIKLKWTFIIESSVILSHLQLKLQICLKHSS